MRETTYGFFKRGLPFGRFLKNFLWSPLCTFSENAGLGDLAKIAITWPFGHFWSRCLHQNVFQSLHFKCMLIKGECHLRESAFGPFKRGLFFGRFLKNFLWSPPCTFLENAGVGDFAKIAITWSFGHFWSRCSHQNLLQSWRYKCMLIRG